MQRVLFRLTARRGQFAPLPELGSRLYLLGREPVSQRLSAARQYVAEALAEEAVEVRDVTLAPAGEGRVRLVAELNVQGAERSVTLML